MLKAPAVTLCMWLGFVALYAAGTPNLCAQTANVAEYRIYECRHIDAKEVDRLLTDLLPDDANTHLVCDTRLNRVLLRGSAESQRIVEDLLKSVDQPPNKQVAAPSPPVVQAYPCPGSEQAQWVEKLRRQYGQQGEVRVTADPNTGKLFVLAPRAVQQQIKQQLQGNQPAGVQLQTDVSPTPKRIQPEIRNGDRPVAAAPPVTSSSVETSGHVLHVRSGKVDFLQQQLLALFDRRLQRREHEARQIYMLELEELDGLLEFQFDETRKAVLVRGPNVAVTQFSKLIEALDRTTQNGRSSQALRIERTSSAHLQKAVDAYRGVDATGRQSGGSAAGSPVG